MDAETINQNFTLKNDSNSDVKGTVTLEGARAIFRPAANLDAGIKYTAKISKDVKNLNGESMESDKEWSFTTIAA